MENITFYLFDTVSSFMDSNPVPTSFVIALAIFLSVVLVGCVVSAIERLFVRIISSFAGIGAALFVVNYLTFLGTVIHELSHALFGILSGAKITEIKFFERPSSGKLGHVTFIPRGNFVTKALQYSFISCAPVVVGGILAFLVLSYGFGSDSILLNLLSGYIVFSLVCHMSMSSTDVRNYFKGAYIIMPVLWGAVLFTISRL